MITKRRVNGRNDEVAIYSNGQQIGKVKKEHGKWGAYDWHGSVICTLVKTNPRWEGQTKWQPVDRLSEAAEQVVEYYNSHLESFAAYLEAKEERAEVKEEFHTSPEVMRMLTDGNDSFYPTPDALAGRMFGKIRKKHMDINTILEPSAGKGNLIDALDRFWYKKFDSWRRDEHIKNRVDVIESDINLQCLLKGKGLKVVSDDFLSYNGNKHYDLILMNPPFDNGDAHLMKAIQLQERFGGEIVCLLNAETIRNPYTNLRKMLKQKLAEHGADIEFVKNGFARAERKTDVEVAIVHLLIEERFQSHFCADNLRKARMRVAETRDQSGLVVANDFVHELIARYNAEAKAGMNIISEFCSIAPLLTADDEYKKIISLEIGEKSVGTNATYAYNKYLELLRLRYWQQLFDRPELQAKMTSAIADKYSSKISSMRAYEIDEYNINQLLFELQGQLVNGVKDSIMQMFEKFTAKHSWYPECESSIHYYNGWRTNLAHKVNDKKVIIPMNGFQSHYSFEKDWKLDEWEISRTISDLERAMRYLDRGEATFFVSPENVARRAAATGDNRNIEFTYFFVTYYKKGTAHITVRLVPLQIRKDERAAAILGLSN